MRAKRFIILALSMILAFSLADCKKQDPTSPENKIIFSFTPAGSSNQQMTVNFNFHCIDPVGIPNCSIFYFMGIGGQNDNDWMSFPQTPDAVTSCLDFIAVVYDQAGAEYTFVGQVEVLPSGVMHSSGNYEKSNPGGGSELGTFTAVCDNIKSGSSVCQ